MEKYLRSKTSRAIFPYNEYLARSPNIEVVSEKEAYPERFAPVDISKREHKVELDIPAEVAEAPVVETPEAIADFSRPIGRGKRMPKGDKPIGG